MSLRAFAAASFGERFLASDRRDREEGSPFGAPPKSVESTPPNDDWSAVPLGGCAGGEAVGLGLPEGLFAPTGASVFSEFLAVPEAAGFGGVVPAEDVGFTVAFFCCDGGTSACLSGVQEHPASAQQAPSKIVIKEGELRWKFITTVSFGGTTVKRESPST